jgi:hypothetical protein
MDRRLRIKPFEVYTNSITGDYAVVKDNDLLIMETVDGNEVMLSFYGKGKRLSYNLVYNDTGTDLLRSSYFIYDERGMLGSIRRYYLDANGDGEYEYLSDRETGKSYDLNRDRLMPK